MKDNMSINVVEHHIKKAPNKFIADEFSKI